MSNIFDNLVPTGKIRILLTPVSGDGRLKMCGGFPESPLYGILQQEFIRANPVGDEPHWIGVEVVEK